jgi:AcrR family transcriptional regulator
MLRAARDLLTGGGTAPSVGEIAARAGVSRLSVYHHFGSRQGILDAVAAAAAGTVTADVLTDESAVDQLRRRMASSSERWASDPALFRSLPAATVADPDADRALAQRLAEADQLRPGCSLREARDVIGVLTSFATFDRLHQDGRRAAASVAEILMRLAAGILADPA